MKIAVLMAGHARSWECCKPNFLEKLYDQSHQIDVFCETYNQVFRTDYHLHNERDMNITKNDEEIHDMFRGINVVHLGIEPEVLGLSEQMQKRKLLKVFDSFLAYENIHGKYDLCIRYRFDLLLDNNLDYSYILDKCTENPKLIFIGDGALHMPENDMFAITNSDTFKIYMNRLNTFPHQEEPMIHHWSMRHIQEVFGTVHSQTIGISIVRLDGNGNFRVEK